MRVLPLLLTVALPWTGPRGFAAPLQPHVTPVSAAPRTIQPASVPGTPNPVNVQVIAPLSFGGLLVQAGGGRCTLTAGGSLLPEGSGVFLGAAPPASYARIQLTGPANAQFRCTLNPSTPVLRGPGGAAIQLASFQPAGPMVGRFGNSGTLELDLGGTLDIPAGAPAGRYTAMALVQLLVNGYPAVTQPLTIVCEVRSPLVLTTLQSLDFGALAAGGGGRFCVEASTWLSLAADGPRLMGGKPHAAVFRFTGPARTSYNLLLPTRITLTGPRGTMDVTDFTCDQDFTQKLPASGIVFHVGACLNVAKDQAPGFYRGTFRVTVAYR